MPLAHSSNIPGLNGLERLQARMVLSSTLHSRGSNSGSLGDPCTRAMSSCSGSPTHLRGGFLTGGRWQTGACMAWHESTGEQASKTHTLCPTPQTPKRSSHRLARPRKHSTSSAMRVTANQTSPDLALLSTHAHLIYPLASFDITQMRARHYVRGACISFESCSRANAGCLRSCLVTGSWD